MDRERLPSIVSGFLLAAIALGAGPGPRHSSAAPRPTRASAGSLLEAGRRSLAAGRWKEARAYLGAALESAVGAGDLLGAGRASAELANVELARGKLREASALFRKALDLVPSAGETRRERASLLLLLAHSEVNLGEYRRALEASRAALELFEAAGDDQGTAHALFRIGAAHDEMGEYEAAHLYLHRALDLCRKTGDRAGEALVLSALGTSYRFIGDHRSALRLLEEARKIFTEQGQSRALCWNHRDTGIVLEELGRIREAETQFRSALDRVSPPGAGWIRADLLFQLGRLVLRSGDAGQGVALLRRGLSESVASQNVWAEASIRVELSRAFAASGDSPRALGLAEEGARIFHRTGAQDLEWEALHAKAALLERAGSPERAMAEYLEAMRILESVRSSIGVPTLRSRYSPRSQRVYEALLRLLDGQYRASGGAEIPPRMFDIAERCRARTFAEILAEGRIDLVAPDDPTRREERDLRAQIASIRTRLSRFANEIVDRQALEDELFEAERRHDGLLLELRRSDSRYAGVVRAETVGARAVPALLRDRADLVAYHLGDEASYGWLVGRGGVKVFELPPRHEIENQVLFFRSLVIHRNDPKALREISLRLHALLLEPVRPLLESGRPLVIVPDGTLFLLPFEALLVSRERQAGPEPPSSPSAGDRYLIQERSVFYIPSLSVLAELRERAVSQGGGERLDLLAVGDPLSPEGSGERRLPFAGSELDRIAALFPTSRRILMRGAEAKESALRACLATPARAVHLATHGILHGTHPERSGLVFTPEEGGGGDGFLSLAEIFDLRLSADLVVLSGCETASGEILRGEGLLGLSRAFFFAGTNVLVASLWKVEDHATEELMVSFYRNLGRGMTVSDALRRSKLARIEASGGMPPDPSTWAGFVALGDGDTTLVLHPSARPDSQAIVLGGALLLILSLLLSAAIRRGRARSASSSTRPDSARCPAPDP